ncbi:MAG: Spy/CpxP family protein refolding chaperone [Muribaculaceae bacterium]|nr:Spy/CpxP family protein refolding chaperone [Muribaculaceae bacterium]
MKKTIFLLTLIVMLVPFVNLSAQTTDADSLDRKETFMKEFRDYKHRFLTKELSLSREQRDKFFPLYDQMEDETATLNNETRQLERRISDSTEKVSDLEYEKATEALFELKIKEGEIEKSYLPRFAEILKPEQLFKLKSAERSFTNDLIHHSRRLKNNRR